MMINMARHPKLSMRKVSSGAEMAVPRVEEQFHTPVAKPRSPLPNQSHTTRTFAGNCGASPMPSAARVAKNCPNPRTNPPTICASDQMARLSESTSRGPKRSTIRPAGNCASAYAPRKAESSRPMSATERPSSSRMSGFAIASVARSM